MATISDPVELAVMNRLALRTQRTRRILCASPKGGSGKTETTKNLAVAAARDGFNVGVVDFDKQRTALKWLSRRPADVPVIQPYEADPSNDEDALQVAELGGHDLVFIDTPPSIEGHPKTLKVLALAADLILIPSRPGISDMESVEKWANLMVQYNRPSMIVLNAIKKRTNRILTARRRLSKAGDLCPVEIPDFDDFLTAGEAGLGVVEIKGAKGADDIDALWAIVRRRIEI